jgi:hypothetical protein
MLAGLAVACPIPSRFHAEWEEPFYERRVKSPWEGVGIPGYRLDAKKVTLAGQQQIIRASEGVIDFGAVPRQPILVPLRIGKIISADDAGYHPMCVRALESIL